MPIRFDRLAIAATDKARSAAFLTTLLGLPEPTAWGPFLCAPRRRGPPDGRRFELLTRPYGAGV